MKVRVMFFAKIKGFDEFVFINFSARPFCTWQNMPETVLPTSIPDFESGQLLLKIFS